MAGSRSDRVYRGENTDFQYARKKDLVISNKGQDGGVAKRQGIQGRKYRFSVPSKIIVISNNGQVAQSVEQGTENPCVGSSILSLATISHLVNSQ